mgnify:CR=1 FL=1
MKISRIVILAMLLAFATVTLASAGNQVLKNQSTTLSASVKNNSGASVRAAVKLTGYDDRGGVIGKLCREMYLSAYRDTTVDFTWQAPAYATGVYWGSKVEVNGSCNSTSTDSTTDTSSYHDDYHDDDDYEYGYDHHDVDYHDEDDD